MRTTASHRDLASLLRELAGLLRPVAHSNRLALVLHDPLRDVMRLHLMAGTGAPVSRISELPVAETPSGLVWQTQRAIVIPSVAAETRYPVVMGIYREEGMRSLCVVPLTSPLRRLGALSFACDRENGFSAADVALLQEVTSHVALAVDNTLHHEAAVHAQSELARERDRLQLLLALNNALVSNLEPRALFQAIASSVRRVVSHEYTSLAVYDPERKAFDMGSPCGSSADAAGVGNALFQYWMRSAMRGTITAPRARVTREVESMLRVGPIGIVIGAALAVVVSARLASGAVTAVSKGGNLALVGDEGDDRMIVKAGVDDDTVFLDQATLQGDVTLKVGDGTNAVTATNSTITGNLTVAAGAGNDTLDTTATTVGGARSIDLDGGTNTEVTP